MLSALESADADIAECLLAKEYRSYAEVEPSNTFAAGVCSSQEYLRLYTIDWTCSLFCTKVFRRALTENIRFRKERRCIDDEFFTYKVLSNAQRIVRIQEALYHYRQRASSAVSSPKNRLQITDDSLEILVERYQWVSSRFPSLRKTYLKHDVEIMFYFANSFDFSEKTQLKFHKIAVYYLGQCLRHFPDLLTLRYAVRLFLMDYRNLPTHQPTENNKVFSEYYP